jgi:Protein of unknown function (DUF3455)
MIGFLLVARYLPLISSLQKPKSTDLKKGRKLMPYMKMKLVIGLVVLLTVSGLVLASVWGFVTLVSMLFADAGHHSQVGIHYASPSWESNTDSKAAAARLEGYSPDLTSIPWLLLEATLTNGPAVFSPVTYIQRVNTQAVYAVLLPDHPSTSQ